MKDLYAVAYAWQRANVRGRVTMVQYRAMRELYMARGWRHIWDAADQALRDYVRAGLDA